MMRHAMLFAAAALLPACGAVSSPATLEETLKSAADYFNKNGTVQLPKELGKARVVADVIGKDTIAIRILDTPTGYSTIDSNVARKMLRGKICENGSAAAVFDKGGKIKVEIVSNIGVEAASFQIAQCPAESEAEKPEEDEKSEK